MPATKIEVDEIKVALSRKGAAAVRKLREIEAQMDELKIAADKAKGVIKADMGEIPLGRKVFATVGGVKVAYHKLFIRRTLNTTLLRKTVDEETINSCTVESAVPEFKLVAQK